MFDNLHGGRDFDKNVLTIQPLSELVRGDRRLLYIQSPGGSGKTFFLSQLAQQCIAQDVVPFLLDLSSKVADASGIQDLEGLFQYAIGGGIDYFEKAKEQEKNRCSMLLIDGLNEADIPYERVLSIIEHTQANYGRASIILTDRMRERTRYPKGFELATIAPLTDEDVQGVLDNVGYEAGKAVALSGGIKRLLRLPFFLDLYLRAPGAFASGRPSTVLDQYLRGCLTQFGRQDQPADPSRIDRQMTGLENLAFEIYHMERARRVQLGRFEELVRPGEDSSIKDAVERLKDARAIETRREGSIETIAFRHQLIHDFLAAGWLAGRPDKWDSENFATLTLSRDSADALVLTCHVLSGKDQGNPNMFVTKVYDWDYPSALDCILAMEAHPVDGAPPVAEDVRTEVYALYAEKAYDPFRHTRERALPRANVLARGLGLDSLPPDLSGLVRELGKNPRRIEDSRYASWSELFRRTGEAKPADYEALLNSNSLIGWTAANVLRRLSLEDRDINVLLWMDRALKATRRKSLEPSTLRWRILHVLGRHGNADTEEYLHRIAFDHTEHRDLRYGAARGLVERASRADSERRAVILGGIAKKIRSVEPSEDGDWRTNEHRAMTAFLNCAILKGNREQDPPQWPEEYAPILEAGHELAKSLADPDPEAWKVRLASLMG
ncbi:MAG: hypothetical protein WD733_06415 [Bryobacterales bacterium]